MDQINKPSIIIITETQSCWQFGYEDIEYKALKEEKIIFIKSSIHYNTKSKKIWQLGMYDYIDRLVSKLEETPYLLLSAIEQELIDQMTVFITVWALILTIPNCMTFMIYYKLK